MARAPVALALFACLAMKLSKEAAAQFPWLLDNRMYSQAGKSLDNFACPRKCKRLSCRCKPFCAICGKGVHCVFHAPLYGKPVGSKPYGHEYARPVTAETLADYLPEVKRAVESVPVELRDDVMQDVLLGFLEDGAPFDLTYVVQQKKLEALRRLDRFKTLSLDAPLTGETNTTFADVLVG